MAPAPARRGVDLIPKLFLLLALGIVLLLGAIGYSVWSHKEFEKGRRGLSRVDEVISVTEKVEDNVVGLAQATDAFLITREASYRISFSTYRDQALSEAAKLTELTAQCPEFGPRSAEFEKSLAEQLKAAHAVINDSRFAERDRPITAEAFNGQLELRLNLLKSVQVLKDFAATARVRALDEIRTTVQFHNIGVVAAAAAAALVLLALWLLMWAGLSKRLSALMLNLSALGSGTSASPLEGSDELARLDRALGEIVRALNAMRAWEKTILGHLTVGLFSLRSSGQFSWVSTRFATDLEYERADLEGHSIFIVASKSDQTRLKDFVETLSKGGKVTDGELALTAKSGRTVRMRLSGSGTPGGEIVCVAQIAPDKREAAAPAAKASQIVEQMPDPVVEFTEELDVIYMNQEARERFADLGREGGRHASLQGISSVVRLLKEGETPAVRRQFTHGGHVYDQRIVAVPTQQCFRAYCHDITKLVREMDDVGRNVAMLERTNATKTEILARIGADLSGPVKALVGYLGLLREDPAISGSGSSAKTLERLTNHVMQIQALGKNIDELQRIDKGDVSIVHENINVRWVLLDVVAQVAPLATPRSVRFQGIDSGPDVYVWADRPQLQQALLELFGSLAKYSRPGGNVVLNWVASEGLVKLAISAVGATGMGGTDAAARTSIGVEALGVGFSVAKRILEHIGGSLTVLSQSGTSLTLSMELPLGTRTGSMAAARNEVLTPSAPAKPPKYTLLFVDDDTVAVELAQDILAARTDIRFESAHRGEEALSKAVRLKPHLIVLDMLLPDMGGLDVLAALKAEKATQEIPVIALTAQSSAEDRERGLQAGLRRYMTKPMSTVALQDAVAVFLPRE